MEADNLELMLHLAARLGASGHAETVGRLLAVGSQGSIPWSSMGVGQEILTASHPQYMVTASQSGAERAAGTEVLHGARLDDSGSSSSRSTSELSSPPTSTVPDRARCGPHHQFQTERELLQMHYYYYYYYQQAAGSLGFFHTPPGLSGASPGTLGPLFPPAVPCPSGVPAMGPLPTGLNVQARSPARTPKGSGAPRDQFTSEPNATPLDLTCSTNNSFVSSMSPMVSNIMSLPGRSRDRFLERAMSTFNYVHRLQRQFILRQDNGGPGRKFSEHFRQALFCIPRKECRLPKFTKLTDDEPSRELLRYYEGVGCGRLN